MIRLVRVQAAAIAGLLALSLLAMLPVLPARAATSIDWAAPTATAEFGTGITFEQPVTATGVDARRVEVLLTQTGVEAQFVRTLPMIGPIVSTTLRYTLLEANAHIYPNTEFSAAWRIIDTSGQVLVGPATTVTYVDTRFDWKSRDGSVIRVHWYAGDEAFGERALRIAEAGVAKAEELFGLTETEPVDFFVYGDLPAFHAAIGPAVPENVGGYALPESRTLFALITSGQIDEAWVGIVIPHELTHLVFDSAVRNPYHDPPHWLNEGIAVYLTEGNTPSHRALMDAAIRDERLIPLNGLQVDFPGDREQFRLSYAEAVSAVDFLVRGYGRDAMVRLVRSYVSGATDAEAFQGALGIDDVGFAAAWLAEIHAKEPAAYGPQPHPPGPLPSGWSATAETAAGPAVPSLDPAPPSSGLPAATPPAGTSTAMPTLAAIAPLPSGAPGSSTRAAGGNASLALLLGGGAVLLTAGALVLLMVSRRPRTP